MLSTETNQLSAVTPKSSKFFELFLRLLRLSTEFEVQGDFEAKSLSIVSFIGTELVTMEFFDARCCN